MTLRPTGPGTHALRIAGFTVALVLLGAGGTLFVGDLLVLLRHRPQFGDGPFGVMVGPIFVLLGAYMLWQLLAAYGLVKAFSVKPR